MELLSPAGSPEALRAAVQNGAEAVYLGWGDFNARRNAKNFTDEEFAQALIYCHERGVRVYLTLNTLLNDRELSGALKTAERACKLGVDAVLVQDWGLLYLLRRALPDLPLHASTQMSIFTSGGACEAVRDGMERVVLARECSREDTAAICKNCPAEIEIFGHGALCMCYSGQCAMSALIGGRSGNRGKCAQPCRMPYGMDGPARGQYPLSLKDTCLAGEISTMEQIGVDCLKLEGRMKRPEYVAIVTRIYARILREHRNPTTAELSELEQAFSRSGFTDWYWRGRKGPGMFGTRPENTPEPTELFRAAKTAYEKGTLRRLDVRFCCRIPAGAPCSLTAVDPNGHSVTVTGSVPETAQRHALSSEEVAERLKKTGGTAYQCVNTEVTVGNNLALSASTINALRRNALAALSKVRTSVPERRVLPAPSLSDAKTTAGEPEFTISVARWEQITPELLDCGPARILVPLELFEKGHALPLAHTEWCAVLPRVWRDWDEPTLLKLLEKAKHLGVTGVLLGNTGHFPLTQHCGLHQYGDYGLNVFNSYALEFFQEKGLQSACISFELRGAQVRDLKKQLPTEAIVYGRLPLMITENCLIANAYGCHSEKDNAAVWPCRDRKCASSHALRDHTGASFPLLPAFGHRTELENSRPLYLGDRPEYRHLGLSYARLRFTTESPEECVRIYRNYLHYAPAPSEFTRGLYVRGVE